jgi:DNA-binding LacI/PurR family transcriptional regulator
VTKRTRTIGLITPGISDHGPVSIAMHFNLAARQARYNVDTVSTVDSDPDTVRLAVEGLLRQRVDAIVAVVTDFGVLELVRSLDINIPIVASASTPRRSPRVVSIDQYRGARAAVRHLIDLGHTKIHHLSGPAAATDSAERIRGWRDELSANALEAPDLLQGQWTPESGYRAGLTLDIEPGSAVFVSNDLSALGLLSALRERGLRVPEDVSVVGFDDVPEAAYFTPPLTTVRQDFAALGRQMMQKVLLSLEESQEEALDTPLPTELVVRDSTQSR